MPLGWCVCVRGDPTTRLIRKTSISVTTRHPFRFSEIRGQRLDGRGAVLEDGLSSSPWQSFHRGVPCAMRGTTRPVACAAGEDSEAPEGEVAESWFQPCRFAFLSQELVPPGNIAAMISVRPPPVPFAWPRYSSSVIM